MPSSTYGRTGLPPSPRSSMAKKKEVVDLPSSTRGTSMAPPSLNDGDLNDDDDNDRKSLTSSSNHRSSSATTTTTSSRSGVVVESDYHVLQTSDKRVQKQKIQEAITSSKLQFDRLPLIGRNNQIDLLNKCLARVASPNDGIHTGRRRRELVLIRGESGQGKSALAMSLQPTVERKYSGMFCFGKYSQPNTAMNDETNNDNKAAQKSHNSSSQNEPLAGIVQVCEEICTKLLQMRRNHINKNGDEKFQMIRDQLLERLDGGSNGEMVKALAGLVSGIEDILSLTSDGKGNNNMTSNISSSQGGIDRIHSEEDDDDDLKSKDRDERINNNDTARKAEQAQMAIRIFLDVVSKHLCPLVVFLDDLQWADSQSLKTIEQLQKEIPSNVTDGGTGNDEDERRQLSEVFRTQGGIMILGSYRSDEVDEEHQLSSLLSKLKRDRNNGEQKEYQQLPLANVTEVEVGDLTEVDIEEMLVTLLSIDQDNDRERLQQLACLIHSRTGGNAFFVKTFLTMMVDEGYLKFNVGSFTWSWEIDQIETETTVTANLVDFIHSRIFKLHPEAIDVLKLAACLGNSVDIDVLRFVWYHIYIQKTTTSFEKEGLCDPNREHTFGETVSILVKESCLELVGSHVDAFESSFSRSLSKDLSIWSNGTGASLHFVHDKVREGVLSNIPFDDLVVLQSQIGMVLLQNFPQENLDSVVFTVVGLLAFGDVIGRSRKVAEDISRLTLRASNKAKNVGAFSSTLSFVRLGIANIEVHDMWKDKDLFDFAIELHSIGAEAAFGLNDYETARSFCEVILEEKRASVLQKCRAVKVYLDMLFFSNKPKCLELALQYLAELGCSFPSNGAVRKIRARLAINETKSKIPSVDDVRKMSMMQDQKIYETIQILETAGSTAFILALHDLNVLIRCRYVDLVLKFGLTNCAASAFASFGNVVMHQLNDIDTALKLAELSLAMQDTLPSQYYKARTVTTVNAFIFQYVRPIRLCLKAFLESYGVGLRSGNIMSSGLSFCAYIMCSFMAGVNLKLVNEDYKNFYSQLNALRGIAPLGQLVQNLTEAESENTTHLAGDYMDERVLSGNSVVWDNWLERVKAGGCCFFGEYVKGANIVMDLGSPEYISKDTAGSGSSFELIWMAVCCYASARQLRKSKYQHYGDKFRSRFQSMAKQGFMNHAIMLQVLDGEFHACRGKTAAAKASFEKAIVSNAKAGFIHNAALSSERYGLFLLEIDTKQGGSENTMEAAYRLKEAIKYYEAWGAMKKVKLMKTLHDDLLSE
mmetsp:Transcript_29760/g.72055  ORF Transcript_29760/g.72055 Transcript_29760/m.72055 type:complete len:1267 (+) Transcript_29760:104-3904(+)